MLFFGADGIVELYTNMSATKVIALSLSTTGAATFSGGRVNIQGAQQNSILLNANAGGTTTGFLIGRSYTSANTQDLFIYDVAAASPRFTIDSTGVVSISNSTASTSTTTGALVVTGGIGAGGSIYAASFFESSDKRVKTLIEDNYQTKGIETITPKLYTKNDKVELGYYAQDVQGILDSSVSESEDGMLSLSYREVHTAKIYALELEIKELKELIKSLIK